MNIFITESYMSYDYSYNTRFIYEIDTKDTCLEIDILDPANNDTARDSVSVHIDDADLNDEPLLNAISEFEKEVQKQLKEKK